MDYVNFGKFGPEYRQEKLTRNDIENKALAANVKTKHSIQESMIALAFKPAMFRLLSQAAIRIAYLDQRLSEQEQFLDFGCWPL